MEVLLKANAMQTYKTNMKKPFNYLRKNIAVEMKKKNLLIRYYVTNKVIFSYYFITKLQCL